MSLLTCDLLNKEETCEQISSVASEITHVFFVTWTKSEDPEKEVEDNLIMLRNVLESLECKSAPLKFVYLQTGTNYYGMHLDKKTATSIPWREDDARLNKPTFYYAQEDYLRDFHQKYSVGNWHYSIGRPPCIIGFCPKTIMSFGVSLAIYASILKELGKPLLYFGSATSFDRLREYVDNKLLAKFIMWSSEDESREGIYNIQNGDYVKMKHLWERAANYFGMESKLADHPFSLREFMKDKDKVWEKIVDRHNLQRYKLKEIGTWEFFEHMVTREIDELSVVSKVHQRGFSECCNTYESFENLFDVLRRKNIIPADEHAKECHA